VIRRDLMGAGKNKGTVHFQEQLIKVIKILIKRGDVATQDNSGLFSLDHVLLGWPSRGRQP